MDYLHPARLDLDAGNCRVMLIDTSSRAMLGWIGGDSEGGAGWHAPDPTAVGPTMRIRDGLFIDSYCTERSVSAVEAG